jgi:hypothetical protein
MPVIPVIWKAEAAGSRLETGINAKTQRLYLKNKLKQKGIGGQGS